MSYKNDLVYYKKILENSIKMYEKTLEQMSVKTVKPESLELVLQSKNDADEQIKCIDKTLKLMENDGCEDVKFVKNLPDHIVANKLVEKLMTFKPYAKNRFVVDFETDDIKDIYIESVRYSGDFMVIRFRNSEDFFAPAYFERNKTFEKVRVFLLDPVGEKKAIVTFFELNVEDFTTDELDYTEDSLLGTEVTFGFKKVVHSDNANRIEKDPQ